MTNSQKQVADFDSKCTGDSCFQRDNCIRFTKPDAPEPVWQCYYLVPPLKMDKGEQTCEWFENNEAHAEEMVSV